MKYGFKLTFLKDFLRARPNINTQKENREEEEDSTSVMKDTTEPADCRPKICITEGQS